MNVNHFRTPILSDEIGLRLNPFEAILVERSLHLLQNSSKLTDVHFWGRISTTDTDGHSYYIAFGYIDDVVASRRFFYTMNCIEWLLLPAMKSELVHRDRKLCKHGLTGHPGRLLEDTTAAIPNGGEKNGAEGDASDASAGKSSTRDSTAVSSNDETHVIRLREEDRLACLVHHITEEAALVPSASLYRRPNARIVANGVSAQADSVDWVDYQRFTVPEHSAVLACDNFTVTIDNSTNWLYIKSLQWPGMLMYHERCATGCYGFVYFGDGRENFDVPFMR